MARLLIPDKLEDAIEGVIYKQKNDVSCIVIKCEKCGKLIKPVLDHGEPRWKVCWDCGTKTDGKYPQLPENIEDMVDNKIYYDKHHAQYILYYCDECHKAMKVKRLNGEPMWRKCRDCSDKNRIEHEPLPEKIEDMVEGVVYRGKFRESMGLTHCRECNEPLVIRYEHGELPKDVICHACFNRTPEKRKIMSDAHLGEVRTEEEKLNLSKKMKAKIANDPVYREHMEQLAKSRIGKPVSEETKKKLSKANKGQKHPAGQDEAHSARMKKIYADPIQKSLMINRMFKGLALKPTKPEKYLEALLEEYYPDTWLYNGDNSCTFKIDGKVPDFVSPYYETKVIELFSYHHCPALHKHIHKNAIGKERLKLFKDHGYDCLIIWEPELVNPELVAEKVKEFIQAS